MVVTLRIGDVLLSTPVIRSLRLAWPEAKIDVLVFEGTEGVLIRNPDIDRVITVPARPGFLRHLRLILSLFRRYDLALTTLLGDRPTLYTWIAGKIRLGMQDGSKKERWKQCLLTHWANFEHVDTHTVLTNLGLVDLLGIKRNHEVVVAWNPSDETAVAKLYRLILAQRLMQCCTCLPNLPTKCGNGMAGLSWPTGSQNKVSVRC